MSQINVYLNFDGKCAEAMKFYQSCLGGDLFLQTVKDSPMAKDWPAHKQELVLHGSITKGPLLLLASDMGENPSGNNICISLTCDTSEELVEAFEKLSAGGERTRPVHDFFAGKIAALKDKYGFDWILYSQNGQQ
ncbi:VOC family protein [Chitinophaga sp. G-6-1-13]|uniref:VOC family protein n=1 Tax=Chitinophaga fulva TaxID=2728842 RepID=A0A848GLI2_9BACT|nr:VOC family protein [Chitinophaga fulva]NML38481.1 VOC family protein [Chitinophaga fulva]